MSISVELKLRKKSRRFHQPARSSVSPLVRPIDRPTDRQIGIESHIGSQTSFRGRLIEALDDLMENILGGAALQPDYELEKRLVDQSAVLGENKRAEMACALVSSASHHRPVDSVKEVLFRSDDKLHSLLRRQLFVIQMLPHHSITRRMFRSLKH